MNTQDFTKHKLLKLVDDPKNSNILQIVKIK